MILNAGERDSRGISLAFQKRMENLCKGEQPSALLPPLRERLGEGGGLLNLKGGAEGNTTGSCTKGRGILAKSR